MSESPGPRAPIVSTAVFVALTLLAIWAVWPSPPGPEIPRPVEDSAPRAADPAALAAARAAARLPSCTSPVVRPAAPAPLAGVVVPCLDGSASTDLGALTAGRTTLINAWASWCAPCRAELPVLAEYAARPGAAAVVTVNIRDDQVAALQLLAELDVRLPSVADPQGAVRAALRGPPTLPASYVVRSDATLVPVEPATPFRDTDEVAAAVEQLR